MAESDVALNAAALAEATALHRAAVARGDAVVAQRFAEAMRVLSADVPPNEHMEDRGDGLRVVETARWEEARDALASLDRARLPLVERPGALAVLAHLNAMAGDAKRATALVLSALKEVDAMGVDYPTEKLFFLEGTHAFALLLDGKAEDVIGILEPLVASDSTDRVRAGHAYFLATAYLALGREDDAKPFFEITAADANPFAGRAKQALVGLANAQGNDPAAALAAALKAAYERGDLAEAEALSTMMRELAADRGGETNGE